MFRRVDIRLGAGRTAIQDVFVCPSRKARIKIINRMQPTAVRMYNPNTEAWDILYTELGGATQLEGKKRRKQDCSDGN